MPCCPASCDGVGFVCRFSLALALGVGQSRSSSVRFPPLDRVPEQARGVGQLVPLADGKDEQPLALVGRADFRRREEACRKAVAHADQSAGDFGEAEAEMMGDILEEDEGRFDLADDAGDMRPEVARVVGAPAFARDGERLARIEPPRIYRRVVCSTTKRPYRVSSGLHRTPPLLLRVGCIRWGREGGGCYTNRPI